MKLSIITVNLNNREGLKKTLDSVACQTWRDFEHIIIDGASTDGSVDVIREYAHGFESRSICQEPSATNTSTHVAQPQTHQHISQPSTISHQPYTIKWLSEPDTGIYNAMNKGIRMANGEYILFLNSGDRFIDDERLECFWGEGFEEEIVYGNLLLEKDSGYEVAKNPDSLTLRTFIEDTINHTGNAFIKKSAFDRFGMYDEELRIVSDWKWFLLSIGLNNATTRHIDLSLSIFDCFGISEQQKGLLQKERDAVLQDVVPQRILQDYLAFSNFEELRYKNELLVRNSFNYRVGAMLLSPIRVIKKMIELCKRKR